MNRVAVEIDEVSKRFRLYHQKYQSLKERALHAGRNTHEEFWALSDVSFDIFEGETVGILGKNGCGKSTLLKCISGILQPTTGKVTVRGKVAALLELGAGFQPELSGRENIFMNASLLGLSTRDVESRFDDIVAFAELEQFIDNQVKYYSSGQYARLGFAVAVNVDPDVLVIDEVLAVGDEKFQRKCLARIKDFQDEGRTILFVTHAPDLVRQICDRVAVLSGGHLLGVGPPGESIRLFREQLFETELLPTVAGDLGQERISAGHKSVSFTGFDLVHPGIGSRPHMYPGETLTIKATYDAVESVSDAVFSIAIYDRTGTLVFASDNDAIGQHFDVSAGSGEIDFSFPRLPLSDGTFGVSLGVRGRSNGEVYDWRDQTLSFEIVDPGRSTGTLALEMEMANLSH